MSRKVQNDQELERKLENKGIKTYTILSPEAVHLIYTTENVYRISN